MNIKFQEFCKIMLDSFSNKKCKFSFIILHNIEFKNLCVYNHIIKINASFSVGSQKAYQFPANCDKLDYFFFRAVGI